MPPQSSFPTVDIHGLSLANTNEEHDEQRRRFCEALEQKGGCYISGIKDILELNERFRTAARQFFQLPQEQKQEYEHPEHFGERGYIEKEREHVAPNAPADLKEFYSIGKEMASYDACEESFFPNVWPDLLPDFQQTGIALFDSLEDVARQLLSVIAEYYEAGADYFDQRTRASNHTLLRSLYFYPLDSSEHYGAAMRTSEHTDIGLMTILLQGDDAPFSFVVDGNWESVYLPDTIFVYVGEMLERLTNGRCAALRHKAVNPQGEKMEQATQAHAFYMHPHSHTDLIPFASCVDADHPKVHEDSSAGAVLDERLHELGLKF